MTERSVRVAVLDDYQRVALSSTDWRIDELGLELVLFDRHLEGEELVAALEPFDIVVAMRERTPFDQHILGRLPRLRLLVSTGMTNAAIDVEAARANGVVVSGTRGLTSAAVELTWALIFAVTRHIAFEDAQLRQGRWQSTVGTGLHGKTLGIVGLGRYGTEVARIGLAMGMTVTAWSQHLDAERAQAVGVRAVPRAELFGTADVVSVHYRLSARSKGLVGAAEIGLMQPESFFVNTSRAEIVDTGALIDALCAERIAGAALDVFDREPLPADDPLLTAPHTVLTPHLGYVTRENYGFFYTDAVKDIAAFLAGAPIRVLT